MKNSEDGKDNDEKDDVNNKEDKKKK